MPKTIRSDYRFYITTPSGARTEAFPANNTLEFSFKRYKNEIFKRKVLETELLFINKESEGINDFTLLYNIDRSNQRCLTMTIEIEKKCDDTFYPYYFGQMATVEGKFNVSKCKVAIKPRSMDKYSCILDNFQTERGIFQRDYVQPIGEPLMPGFVGSQMIYEGNADVFTCEFTWTIYNNYDATPDGPVYIDWPTDEQIREQGECNIPDGFNIIKIDYEHLLGSYDEPPYYVKRKYKITYARHAYLEPGLLLYEPFNPNLAIFDVDNNLIRELKNGKLFSECIDYIVQFCGLRLKSNFLNYRPDGTAPDNYAYQNAVKYCHRLTINLIDNIRQIEASDPATIGLVTLEDLTQDARAMYNLYWDVDDEGNFILEHHSYFKRDKLLNLTSEANKKLIEGLYEYEYNDFEIPQTETWSWPSESFQEDFRGLPIKYPSPCSTDGEFKKVDFGTKVLFTDAKDINARPDEYRADIRSFVILSTGPNYSQGGTFEILDVEGLLSGQKILNGCNAWANLMDYYHQYERPHPSGELNREMKTFFTIKRTRQQVDINIPLCCEQMLNFNPEILVKTQMGWGDILEANIEAPSEKLTVKLIHK